MNTLSYYRIEVAPLTILPLQRSPFFTYFSRKPVPDGSLVEIPFGSQELHGIVSHSASLPTRPASWMKEIRSIIIPSFVTPRQLSLAQTISDLSFTSLGRTLTHFVPDISLATKKELSFSRNQSKPRFRTSLKKEIVPLMTPGRHALSISPQDRDEALAFLIKERMKNKQSLLVIVPEIIGAELLSSSLEQFRIPHFLLTSAVSKKQLSIAWEGTRKKGFVLIGTRQALFAPFVQLDTIILLDTIDDAYKQWDMSPRYDGRRVADLLADSFGADLITFSPFLSVSDTHKKNDKHLSHTDLVAHEILAPIETVNLRLERYRKNYSPLSETARLRIGSAISRGETVVLIVNQSGYSKISRCEECKHIFRCQQCEASLHPEKSGEYICDSCNFRTSIFPNCPNCGHLGFRQIGFGTERVEREVKKQFPKATIRRIDRLSLETKSARSSLIQNHLSESVDIIIGVPSILNHLSSPSIKTVVFVDVDTFLSWSDFRTDEHFFERVFRSRLLAGKNGIVIMETFQPESAFFRKLATETYEHIVQSILEDRSALNYPPFSELIAIEVLRNTTLSANTDVEKLGQAIQALPESEKWRIFIQQAPERRFRGKYIARVLIRVKKILFTKALEKQLRSLPKETFVDRDPLSLHI